MAFPTEYGYPLVYPGAEQYTLDEVRKGIINIKS